MLPTTKQEQRQLTIGLVFLAALIAATIWLTFSGLLHTFSRRLFDIFESREEMRAYLQSWGAWAPVAFALIQALQVIISPIPGELTGLAGGFAFGTWQAVIYSVAGLTLGSVLAFTGARIIGLPLVKLAVQRETLEKFSFLSQRSGTVTAFVLFLIPGFPKDFLSYLLGLSEMKFVTFVLVCALGRAPGTVMLALTGAALYKENWRLIVGIASVALIAVLFFWVKRERIRIWFKEKEPVSKKTDT